MKCLSTILGATAALAAVPASATLVSVTVENLSTTDGLYFTPVWLGFHDGSFDLFDAGAPASAGLELIAELGMPSALAGEFSAAAPSGLGHVLANPSGPGGVIFDPGASQTVVLDLDAMDHRYFSFATMLVPSNDTFLGLGDPMAVELFNGAGEFLGADLMFSAAMAYDSGTEADDPSDGGAFVAGADGMAGGPGEGAVMLQELASLEALLGITVPTGATIGSIDGPLFRVHLEAIPEPGVVGPLAGLFLFLPLMMRRRR